MNMYDLIFWYSGITIWIILAIILAIGTILIWVWLLHRIYLVKKQWMFSKMMCMKERKAISGAITYVGYPGNISEKEYLEWLDKISKEYFKLKGNDDDPE